MTHTRLVFAILIWLASGAQAATLTETFSSRSTYASGTAIWNQALGKIHPSLKVVDYKAGFTPITVDLGDGSHGIFNESTYASFSVGGDISGNKIRFDTGTYPILKVTSFYLAPGWVLEPVGSSPLIIYSLSDVIVEGDIWCHGNDGGNASGTTRGLGGSGRCGGANGGNGGLVGGSGANGTSIDGAVTHGGGGVFAGAAAVCGGGGGSWNTTTLSTAGSNAAGANGGAGFSSSDPEFDTIAGGAGGGGGAASTASGGVAGAGGGAGGGAIIIHAGRDFTLGSSLTATIGTMTVNGGNGGSSNVQGGAGGGGGGGSTLVFAGRTINIYNTDASGAAQANNGLGGSNSNGHNGGNGGPGRNWFASNVDNYVGFYTPAEQAPVNANPWLGIVQYTSTSEYVISQPIHFQGSFTQIQSLSTTPTSNDFLFEVAGSSDNFVNDDTGFTTDLSQLSSKNYLRFRLTLTASNVNTPDMIDMASIQYLAGQQDDFNMKTAGCGRIDAAAPPSNGIFLLIALAFLLVLKFKAQRQKSIGI